MKITDKILLPSAGETAAITLKPKTAALCFERVWAASNDTVPESIRCWGGTKPELNGVGLAADFNIKTNRTSIVAMVGPEDIKLELMQSGTDYGLAMAFRKISIGFAIEHKIPLTPVFDFIKQRNTMYKEGDREVIVAALDNIEIVDEKELTWEQVEEFRKDRDNQNTHIRLLHWLDKEMIGKSQKFIEDEIIVKLDGYHSSLRKHGIKTVIGTIEEALDGKYIIPAGIASFVGHPVLGIFLAAGFMFGKIAVKLAQIKIAFDEIERGPNSEISWVYEVKKLS